MPSHIDNTASIIGVVFVSAVLASCGGPGATAGAPHVDHVKLPAHRTWSVVSVQPYEGLSEVELVKFDWPTADQPSMAFALTKEGLSVGDAICLDHVREIDTYWAHPVPGGGCEAFGKGKPAGRE